jgi:signal transduction histidine kinase/ligand-binding sensor domain-containing protein
MLAQPSVLTLIASTIAKAVAFLTLVLASSDAHAQLNPDNLSYYTQKEGLPGTQVNAIATDEFGYVWVGTNNGLARFDGNRFRRFYNNPNDPGSISGMVVRSILADSKGRIWVGSSPSFLNRYDPVSQSFRKYPFKHLVRHLVHGEPNVSTIIERDGRVYFGIKTSHVQETSSALLYFDEKEDEIKAITVPPSLRVSDILNSTLDNHGNIWFAGAGGVLKLEKDDKLSLVSPKQSSLSNDEYLIDLLGDDKGGLWFITNESSIGFFDPETDAFEIYARLQSNLEGKYNTISFDPKGNIWMGTILGLYLFDRESKKVLSFDSNSSNSITTESILSLLYDRFGNLWIGSGTHGLLKYEERSFFKAFSPDRDNPSSITPGWVNRIFESSDGTIWITTSGIFEQSGINIFDQEKFSLIPIPYRSISPDVSKVFGVIEGSGNEIIMSTDMGFHSFSKSTKTFKKRSFLGLPDSVIVSHFLHDRNGDLWLSSNVGLFRQKKGAQTLDHFDLRISSNEDEYSNQIKQAVESRGDGIWLLTNNGLFLYRYETNQIERIGYDKEKGDVFLTQDINSFYEDKLGSVWVGTWQGGLSRLDLKSGKIRTFTVNDGLPSMSIQSILADDQNNNLWMSTFEGLCRLDIPSLQFYSYSVDEGIQSQLFTEGAFLETSKGMFLFGGAYGITLFDPNQANENSLPPRVYLTDFKLFNKSVIPGENSILKKPIYETREITLGPKQNNISIEFIALHYANPAKNRYAFRLENYDDDWHEVVNFQAAFYPNLPPGEYNFHVKAANNIGVWDNEGAQLRIIVKNPWWNTVWAYLLYGVILFTGVFGADRFFRHQVVVKERARAQIRELAQAKEIEKAYTKLQATQAQLIHSEKMASLGELTAGIAHEIQNPLNFVNNFSEVSEEMIDEIERERGKVPETRDERLIDFNLKDVKENLVKIKEHGKRADSIVKGMLEHSRKHSGEKLPTNVNTLAEEFLRLSYHGMRAKDKAFVANFETDFDRNLPNITLVPQDIGRVLLNIFNNGFYAVYDRAKKGEEGYAPKVTVSTRMADGKVSISIADNGPGIPDHVKEKIFQPFFTTKPTGQGTGLGLSLSYDIIKAHGGSIKVNSVAGQGSEFIVEIPV